MQLILYIVYSAKRPSNLEKIRAQVATPTVIEKWFQTLDDTLVQCKIKTLHNLDETMITGDKNMGKIKDRMITIPGCNVRATSDGYRGHVSMATYVTLSLDGSRNGKVAPPIVLYSGKKTMDYMIKGVVHQGLAKATENGYMDSIAFLEYLTYLVETVNYIKSGDGILLDGHSSHFSLEMLQYCQEKSLHLIRMPAHCTHLLQPLDVSLFNIFKAKYVF